MNECMRASERLTRLPRRSRLFHSPLPPFLPPSQLQTSSISGAGTADEQGASAGFTREMELIRLGREPCSGSRLTLRKGGEVDEGATALRPAAALHGLFLFLVSIRCQTNDAVSRNTTAAGVCRGEGVGVRDRGEKATFVGRSVGRSSPFSFPLPRFCHCHCHCRRRRLNSHQHHQRVRCVMHGGEGARVWATEDGPSTLRGSLGSGGIASARLMDYALVLCKKRERREYEAAAFVQ